LHSTNCDQTDELIVSSGSLTNNTITNNREGIRIFRTIYNYEILVQGIHFNNIYNNSEYAVFNSTLADVDLNSNWWGTTDISLIVDKMHDYTDDWRLGEILYEPILNEPISAAPVP